MKIQFTLSSTPIDANYPIEAYEIGVKGQVRGPFYYSIEDMVSALHEVKDSEDTFVRMPILPMHTVHVSHTRNMNRFKLVLDFPKSIQTIHYETSSEKRVDFIGIPRTLMIVGVEKTKENRWKVVSESTKLFAIEEHANIQEDTTLYHFPFPNVYKDEDVGKICWGLNQLPLFDELKDLESLFQLFLSAPFNEDLGIRLFTKKVVNSFSDYLQLMEKNEKPQPFNDEELISCSQVLGVFI